MLINTLITTIRPFNKEKSYNKLITIYFLTTRKNCEDQHTKSEWAKNFGGLINWEGQ